jgi:hypothetical protein
MNPIEIKAVASRRQALLGQLKAAEAGLRSGLHLHGFGGTAHAHMERAMAHICEACLAINESKPVRSVQQLVADLIRVEQVIEDARRQKSQRI